MKGGVVAALHALAAVARPARRTPRGRPALRSPREEDGGLGAFAALERDAAFAAVPDPRADGLRRRLRAGRRADVRGHRARRRRPRRPPPRGRLGHRPLPARPRRARRPRGALNAAVEHPLMRALELPYPVLVGRLRAGEWSSSVPDRLVFEGRAPVRVGEASRRRRAARRGRGRRAPATGTSSCAGPAGTSPRPRRRPTTRSPRSPRRRRGASSARAPRRGGPVGRRHAAVRARAASRP